MNELSRIRSPRSAAQRAARIASGTGQRRSEAIPPQLWVAFSVQCVAALAFAASQPLGVVAAAGSPGFAAFPLLVVLAILPVAIVLWLLLRGRATAAAGMLMALGLIAVGSAVADSQLAVNAGLLGRPELWVPVDVAKPPAGPGFWTLMLGYVLTIAAGLCAVTRLGQPDPATPRKPGALALVLPVGLAIGLGLSMAPFDSGNPFLPSPGTLDSPVLTLIGGLFVALVIPVGAVFAASSDDPEEARGGLLGLGIGAAMIALTRIADGLFVAQARPAPGPYLAMAGAIVFLVIAVSRCALRAYSGADVSATALPGQRTLRTVAGWLGICAGALAIAAANVPQLVVSSRLDMPENYSGRLLIPAGILVVLLGLAMLTGWATVIQPTFIVALVGIPLAATGSIDTVLTALSASSVTAGPGSWLAGLAIVVAALAAISAAVAGVIERDEVDLDGLSSRRALVVPVGFAVVFAVGSFWFPVLDAPGYALPDLWSNFRFTSWGLLSALASVVIAGVLALRSRPSRAAALLIGAVVILGIRLLEVPLTAPRFPTAVLGIGAFSAMACILCLITSAVILILPESRIRRA